MLTYNNEAFLNYAICGLSIDDSEVLPNSENAHRPLYFTDLDARKELYKSNSIFEKKKCEVSNSKENTTQESEEAIICEDDILIDMNIVWPSNCRIKV